jgi:rhodanese-related sulfurtransferase
MFRKLIGISNKASPAPAAEEITVPEFLRNYSGVPVQVVDVREPDEWAQGHMSGSRLIPMREVTGRVRELDPHTPVIMVCRSGRRSMIAAEALIRAGFLDVKSLAGGMIAWVDAGQPVEP